MLLIGESIHIISPKVKEALAARDGAFFVELARKQKEAGADALDLNIGPQKKAGPEVTGRLVDCVQEAVGGMTLSFDTTNLAAIEVGLKKIAKNGRANAIVKSTSAEAELLATCDRLRGILAGAVGLGDARLIRMGDLLQIRLCRPGALADAAVDGPARGRHRARNVVAGPTVAGQCRCDLLPVGRPRLFPRSPVGHLRASIVQGVPLAATGQCCLGAYLRVL